MTLRELIPRELCMYELQQLKSSSPGCAFGSRVAACASGSETWAYVASGKNVYMTVVELGKSSTFAAGKEGVLLPRKSSLSHPLQPCPALQAQAEIQSLSLTQLGSTSGRSVALASMDAYGRGLVSVIPPAAAGADRLGAPEAQALPESSRGMHQDACSLDATASGGLGAAAPTYVLEPPGRLEAGWSGVCMFEVPNAGGELAATSASHLGHSLSFYQCDRRVRAARTLHPPAALATLPSGQCGQGAVEHTVACAEGHQVSLWDVRQGERGGLMHRVSVAPGGSPIYGLSWCAAQGGLLGTAGAERAVALLEPRKNFGLVHKWTGCAKYTIHHLEFSGVDPHWAYVAGLDYECVCGRWDGRGTSCSGNINSSTGGHGRAVGPRIRVVKEDKEALGLESGPTDVKKGTADIKFRGQTQWSGMSLAAQREGTDTKHDILVAATQSHHLFVLDVTANENE